jgi:hypothetical protein
VSIAGVGGTLAWVALRERVASARGQWPRLYMEEEVRRDRFIAATIAVMPLLMPFYFDYDLLLLAVPATLYAVERVRRPELARDGDIWLTRAWVALYLWLFVNPGLAMHTHVNLTVILLTCVASLLIARLRRRQTQTIALSTSAEQVTSRAIAA